MLHPQTFCSLLRELFCHERDNGKFPFALVPTAARRRTCTWPCIRAATTGYSPPPGHAPRPPPLVPPHLRRSPSLRASPSCVLNFHAALPCLHLSRASALALRSFFFLGSAAASSSLAGDTFLLYGALWSLVLLYPRHTRPRACTPRRSALQWFTPRCSVYPLALHIQTHSI